MDIITVHGIRRQLRWNERLSQLQTIKQNEIRVVPFDYGYFNVFKFLWPPARKKIINEFCNFYNNKFKNHRIAPSVIAHSFGTFIVLMAMKRYDSIKFNTIIFCGCVLNSKIDLREFLNKKQFIKIINDHGSREWFIFITRIILGEFGGIAGRVGFKDIPENHLREIINRKNYLGHSDYFLDVHMEKNWIPEILKSKISYLYKKSILRPEIIERIYINQDECNIKITEKEFYARVDKDGHYYAKYVVTLLNESHGQCDHFIFSTTADGPNDINKMNIVPRNSSNEVLSYEIVKDDRFYKVIRIILDKPMNHKEERFIKIYFKWDNTLNLDRGDVDHFTIIGCKSTFFQLNLPYKLLNFKIFYVQNRDLVNLLVPEQREEKDGTYTYSHKLTNNENYDGIIFYYEGSILRKKYQSNLNYKLRNPAKLYDDPIIQIAEPSDLKEIYKIELDIEHGNAASESVLKDRMNMFNEGFLVLKRGGKVIGYIESLIWNEKPFETFDEIKEFPINYNVRGNTWYIIFLAIVTKYRRKGYGTKLLKQIEDLAKHFEIYKISLVAKGTLVEFYKKRGFKAIRQLPTFLKNKGHNSILMEKKLERNK